MIQPEVLTLKNGLKLIVIPDHRAPIVTHMVWYNVGSADEVPGKTGLAHFLEHLMFKGTKAIKPGQFSREIARHGGDSNAFTSYDYTAYFERIPRDRLPLVMRMEADRMLNLSLDEKDVLHERDVILEERRMRVDNDPFELLRSDMEHQFFKDSPYGEDPIGTYRDIEHLTREDVLSFYKRFYTPNNAFVVVAGDITLGEAAALAKEIYGPLEETAQMPKRKRTPPALPEKPIAIEHADRRAQNVQFVRFFYAPSPHEAGQKFSLALDMAMKILGGDETSRLYNELVVNRRIASDVATSYDSSMLGLGKVTFEVTLAPGREDDVEILREAVNSVVKKFLSACPTEDEVSRAKVLTEAFYIYASDHQMALARIYGISLTTGMTLEDVYDSPKMVEAISDCDIMEAAKRVLEGRSFVEGVLNPHEILPDSSKKTDEKITEDVK